MQFTSLKQNSIELTFFFMNLCPSKFGFQRSEETDLIKCLIQYILVYFNEFRKQTCSFIAFRFHKNIKQIIVLVIGKVRCLIEITYNGICYIFMNTINNYCHKTLLHFERLLIWLLIYFYHT